MWSTRDHDGREEGIIIKFVIYQGNQCLSPTKVVSCGFSLIRRCTCFWYTHISHKFIDSPIKGPQGAYTYTIYEQVLSLTCSRFIDLFGNSSFLHQYIKLTAMIMRKYSYKVVHLVLIEILYPCPWLIHLKCDLVITWNRMFVRWYILYICMWLQGNEKNKK